MRIDQVEAASTRQSGTKQTTSTADGGCRERGGWEKRKALCRAGRYRWFGEKLSEELLLQRVRNSAPRRPVSCFCTSLFAGPCRARVMCYGTDWVKACLGARSRGEGRGKSRWRARLIFSSRGEARQERSGACVGGRSDDGHLRILAAKDGSGS